MIPARIESVIDPVYAEWLKATQVELPEGFVPTTEQMRDAFAQMTASVDNPVDSSITVTDNAVQGRDGNAIAVRVYQHSAVNDASPVVVFIHGGGWVLGNLDTHNGLCGDIALKSGFSVVAIDYRLSPEVQFPAALHDCEDVVAHLVANASELNIDTSRMAIMGDSAGGNLAAACSLSLAKNQFKAQVLVYPALAANPESDSHKENADVPGLTAEEMEFYFRAYNGGVEPVSPLVAPVTVEDVSAQPPTFISVAALDPLRDDGIIYKDKLDKAGVSAVLRIEESFGHSYLWLRNASPAAAEAFAAQMEYLKKQLA